MPGLNLRVNDAIRAPRLRVIAADGTQAGVMDLRAALAYAAAAGLDLVEVSPTADPPVAKVADYGRMRYDASVAERAARKTQKHAEVKEVRMRPAIDNHDFDVKIAAARRFLAHGDKVKISVQLRGREQSRPDAAVRLLERALDTLDDAGAGTVEGVIRRDGRTFHAIVAPAAR